MNRRDIIRAIRATQDRIAGDPTLADLGQRQLDQMRGVRRTAAHIADVIARDNPDFDVVTFLERAALDSRWIFVDCGYGA